MRPPGPAASGARAAEQQPTLAEALLLPLGDLVVVQGEVDVEGVAQLRDHAVGRLVEVQRQTRGERAVAAHTGREQHEYHLGHGTPCAKSMSYETAMEHLGTVRRMLPLTWRGTVRRAGVRVRHMLARPAPTRVLHPGEA
ncbi:hypothetical protein [Cellulomonas sp. PS-H5]|uniref:hypothetical protein n=1 Tax=Cellulomonas sp. PS-H5 TaxID=2820400 RepID=UPI001C4F52C3|nr:hypothetical protein [Cellulomonas sp. PS-H5]MBW0253743.1 hypothetical protein [Cellulomonas sp. PS-H5]